MEQQGKVVMRNGMSKTRNGNAELGTETLWRGGAKRSNRNGKEWRRCAMALRRCETSGGGEVRPSDGRLSNGIAKRMTAMAE